MRKTARQERIGQEIEAARVAVIHFELNIDYLEDAKKEIKKGNLTESDVINNLPYNCKNIDEAIKYYSDQWKVYLHRLNFFKETRKKEINRISEKEALKVKNTVPQEIKVNVVDTIAKK